ncbi:MAG: hypothetical protein P8L39_16695 [Halioglobus sp.]|nr:hypothetical protein [Halioglobus sp.]
MTNSIRIKFTLHTLAVLTPVLAWTVLSGCQSDQSPSVDLCQPFEDLTPICGFQSPEDLAVLPDKSGLLVSEFGQMGDADGTLSMLSVTDNTRRVLYAADMLRSSPSATQVWGDPTCREPDRFSPHGIDLTQRPSGRWQLLVVNHLEHDRVEFFELAKDSSAAWSLTWMGCVHSNDDSLYNDVAAVKDGFIVSRMMSNKNTGLAMINYALGRDTGYVLRWSLETGFQTVANTQGVMPNGVVAAPDGSHVFVNLYGENKVRVIDTNYQTILADLDITSADNTNWDITQKNKLLIASHEFNFFAMIKCMAGADDNCESPFEVIELDTTDYSQRSLVVNNGKFFGAATSAVRLGNKLYIGSFSGNRILIAPIGHGVVQ